jgi:RNA polymerase sigma-70 factor, ECF subfamily
MASTARAIPPFVVVSSAVSFGVTGAGPMDRAALEELYRRYGASVLRRARRLLRDEAAARDAMHDVFLKAWRAGEAFRHEASPMTWLYHITTNHCLNQIRDEQRRRELLAVRDPDEPPPTTTDRRVLATQLLERIPASLRAIAVYYFIDQMSHDEIAEIIGMSRRTVGYRIEEVRRLLSV